MIRIDVGGHEYESWDALPEEVRAQLVAAGVDPGPDGRLDSLDLMRAAGTVSRRTVVTAPDGPAATVPEVRVPDDRVPDDAGDHPDDSGQDVDVATGRSRRVPLVLGWIVIGATVLLVATVVVIGLSGV